MQHIPISFFHFRFLNFIVFLLRNLFRNIDECSKPPPEVKEAEGSIIQMEANDGVILDSDCFKQHVTNLLKGLRVYKVGQKERKKREGGKVEEWGIAR